MQRFEADRFSFPFSTILQDTVIQFCSGAVAKIASLSLDIGIKTDDPNKTYLLARNVARGNGGYQLSDFKLSPYYSNIYQDGTVTLQFIETTTGYQTPDVRTIQEVEIQLSGVDDN